MTHDRVYVYCSNDDESPVGGSYNIPNVVCISSNDMKNWTDRGVVFDAEEDNLMGAKDVGADGDRAQRQILSLLRSPQKRALEETAGECGFATVRAFRKAFERVTRETLAAFREKCRHSSP